MNAFSLAASVLAGALLCTAPAVHAGPTCTTIERAASTTCATAGDRCAPARPRLIGDSLLVSTIPSHGDHKVTSTVQSWPEFSARFRAPRDASISKDALPLWSAASYRYDYQKDEYVTGVFALTFDVDEAPVPSRGEIETALRGIRGVVHTSSRSTAEAPRWRLVLSLSRPVTGEEHRRIWGAVAGTLPFPVGKQSKNPSRGWYEARRGTDGSYECFSLEGAPLDVDLALESAPAVAGTPNAPSTEAPAPACDTRKAAAVLLASAWPPAGKRCDARLALSGALRNAKLSQATATTFVQTVHAHIPDRGDETDDKLAALVASTYAKGEHEKIAGWPSLKRHLAPAIVDAAHDLLNSDLQTMKQLTAELDAKEAANDTTATRDGDGLGFTFDGWQTEPPPIDFLVGGLVPSSSVGIVFGRADSLKTWFLFSLGIAVAKGEPWLGFPTTRGRVGIVDYETGRYNMRRRLYMLRAGDCGGQLGCKSFATLKPNTREFWVALAKEDFDLVIIDSLRRANPGANENDSGEAIVPLELAGEFSELTGCAVLFIHHAKKASDDGWPEFRGSAAIEDQVDFAYATRKVEVSPDRKRVEIRCAKPGDMRPPEPFAVEVTFDDIKKTTALSLVGVQPSVREVQEDHMTEAQIRAAIRLVLSNGPIATKEKIKAQVKGTRAAVYAEIDAMKATGEIAKIVDVGFVLDDSTARRDRVIAQVREYRNWLSAAKLAKASHVPTAFVEKLVRDEVIMPVSPNPSAPLGYFIPPPRP